MELAYTGLSGGYKSCLQLTAIVLSSSATCRYDLGGGEQYKKIMEYIYCSLRN